SIIASLSIKRIPEQDIIDEVYRQTKKTLTKSGMFYIRKDIKKESYQWYKTMREGEYEYIHEFRERINEILDLQKRHYEIADSSMIPIPVKQASLFELHKLSVTLSNLFDVAPFITNSISNNATLPAPPENKTAEPEATTSYVV
ncbi:MAG: hypothetical protein WA421_07690, partial [Nitrososphaeraceae archaeon]